MAAQTGTGRGRISAYFKGVRAEMKKVIWPSKTELVNYTGVVILMSAIIGLVVWILDLGIHRVLSLIIK